MYRYAILWCLLLYILVSLPLYSQTGTLSWQEQTRFSTATPNAFRYGYHTFGNVAMMNANNSFDMMATFATRPTTSPLPGMWGMSMMFPSGILPFAQGLGFIRTGYDSLAVVDWRYAIAFGGKSGGIGIGYGWSTGDDTLFKRSGQLTFSFMQRNNDLYSTGYTRIQPLRDFAIGDNVFELSIRPLSNYRLTLYGDVAYYDRNPLPNTDSSRLRYSVGGIIEPINGLRINGRYFSDKRLSVGVDIGLGALGFAFHQHNNSSTTEYKTYTLHMGGDDRSITSAMSSPHRYVNMSLLGGIKYQRFQLFDNSRTLLETLEQLEEIRNDNTVYGVVLNCSGMNIADEMMWEIREHLQLIRKAGKQVVIYIDRVDLSDYYFASVASKIVLDPVGSIYLGGYASGRTYMKRTLEKIGVGYDELRFFKYKSAAEGFARTDMSEGEREQRTKLLQDRYDLASNGIAAARKVSKQMFDSLLNAKMMLLPEEAIKLGFADTLARFDDLSEVVKKIDPEAMMSSMRFVGSNREVGDERWGNDETIAVIYAIGACSMDGGINARSLVHDVESAANNPAIKAIVLRVDSPGGDPLASDLIAKALLTAKKKKKPVIVSQGVVAGSGGYWLSMNADVIVAAPNTITGSIGVISSFFYTKWLADTAGLNFDVVKIGKFSDIGLGPDFMGLASIPARGYTTEERTQREQDIRAMYKDFVARVASGRNKDTSVIANIAQGRVWSGTDGKNIGLVDEIGGLADAINIAKQKAGIQGKANIIELPAQRLIDFNQFMPKLIGVTVPLVQQNPMLDLFKFRLENNGKPMVMMPLEWDEEITK